MSPGLIFSIATKPLAVRTSVPATKHFIVVGIPPVNTAVAVTPIWKMLNALLSCNLALRAAIIYPLELLIFMPKLMGELMLNTLDRHPRKFSLLQAYMPALNIVLPFLCFLIQKNILRF